MPRVSRHRVYWLPFTLLILLVLLFVSAGLYLANDERAARISKAQSVAEQARISLEVFSQEREQALINLMQNWPTFEPNPVDWFNAQAVSLMGMQRGFSSLAYADQYGRIEWITLPGYRQLARVDNTLIGQPITSLGIQVPKMSEAFTHTLLYSDRTGRHYIVIGRAISPQEPEHGFVIASFDVDSILDTMLGELVGPQFSFTLFDGDTELFAASTIIEDGSAVSPRPIEFIERQWSLVMQSRVSGINPGLIVVIVGTLMSMLVSWIFHKQLIGAVNLTVSQQRYQTASDAALDALLIYQPEGDDFELVESNRFSRQLFCGEVSRIWGRRLSEQLTLLDLVHLMEHARRVAQEGKPYEEYGNIEHPNIQAEWLKFQLVKAGKNIAITVRDVTERFKAQQALEQNEERYRRLVDGMHRHFVYTRTSGYRFTYVSAGITNILGFEPDYFCQHSHKLVRQLPDNAMTIQSEIRQGEKPEPYLVYFKGQSGEEHVIEFADTPILDEQGRIIAVEGIARDVTTEQALQEEVVFQANHDQLTGLMNRYAFDNQLKQLLKQVKRGEDNGVMCFVDMDRFKLVNDSCGHPAGDKLLKEIADLFQEHVSDKDLLARIGGDEFCIIYRNLTVDTVRDKLDILLQAISNYRFVHDDKLFFVGASIGVIEINAQSRSAAELIKAADNACYEAKYLGRNRYCLVKPDEGQLGNGTENNVLNILHQALQQDGFELFCQSILPMKPQYQPLEHFEILLRLPTAEGELISPAMFIPLAERHGLMNKIDWWVVDKTLTIFEHNSSFVKQVGKVAINLSGITLGDELLLQKIAERVKESSLPADKLCFEITETTAVLNLNAAKQFITQLRELGCHFALDDFGAGMSSFTYLKNLDVDYVKIDGSFVRNCARDPIDHATVKAINSIAHSMGKQTVAEFVTDEQTYRTLQELEVDFGQGYALGKPMPLADRLGASQNRKSA